MDGTSLTLLERLRCRPAQEDWTRLIALYRPFIERFVRLDAALSSDADDICQEVLRKVVENFGRFQRQRDGSFRAWLKVITINEVRYFWRRRQRETQRSGSDPFLVDALQDPHNELSQRWDAEHTQHVLTRLQDLVAPEFSPTTWQAFRLRVLQEKPTEEVAALLGMSRNAVDIAKSRVLARLRQEAAEIIDE
jgi:RNA polymerase sigma-70 factor, ECF subfamily